MLFPTPVKFIKSETKSGVSKKNDRPYEIVEATIFVPDLGRVKVPVVGSPKLPDPGTTIQLSLSVEQGSFQSLRVVWDSSSQFKAA
ncbi:hypothetical protein [Geobacter sp. SVR]|uniref:hypothetical protein n=1 Tax=Geobacter sp. SVR TaxID=2495594 RepID=UPI00143EFF40|nr:hypothetical protein [Geobacter sp. SVR]BCS53908.1 hypothetical protein GSVR_22160 [Geobacter sp. SVR]GCF86313.1 hypothetical protein GSbR_29130 [Geobacter sp. SVR]